MYIRSAKVIINPFARGGRTGKRWPQISELLKDAGLSFDHDFTEGVGHGIELAREAVAKGYELVIAVGGDGTVNEVVNGLVDEGGKGRATLGIISMGVGSDAVRSLGIPRDYAEACRLFSNFKRVTIDLGAVEYMRGNERVRRLFVNTAGLGFDAAVIEGTKRRLKIIRGTVPYVVGLMTTLVTYRNKEAALSIDGVRQDERIFFVVVNNGRYFGGGMKIAPDADPCDGLLDVVIAGDAGKIEVLWFLPRVYRGTHVTHPKVRMYQAKSIEVNSSQRLLLQADGELLGEAPASFSVLPAALTVAISGEIPSKENLG